MKVSVNAVWDETLAFIRAERALIVPLALGTIYLGTVVSIFTSLSMPPAARNLVFIIAGAWGIAGELALIDLTRGAGRSVREALGVGLRRLPWALLVYFVIVLMLTVLLVPIVYALMKTGYTLDQLVVLLADQAKARALMMTLPSWATFYMLAVSAFAVFVSVRLMLWKAALVELGQLVPAFRASWEGTRGKFWALLGLALLAFLILQLVNWALTSGLGALFLIIGASLGSPVLAKILPALLIALVSVAIQTVIVLFLAIFYRRAAA